MRTFKLSLIFLFVLQAYSQVPPCPQEFIASPPTLEPSELLRAILRGVRLRDHKDEPIMVTYESIEIQDNILTLEAPLFNNQRLSFIELYCTEFGTSLFGREICLRSADRPIDQAVCQSLGLEPYRAEPFMISDRDARNVFYFHEQSWQSHSTRMPGNRRYEFQVLGRLSCRL